MYDRISQDEVYIKNHSLININGLTFLSLQVLLSSHMISVTLNARSQYQMQNYRILSYKLNQNKLHKRKKSYTSRNYVPTYLHETGMSHSYNTTIIKSYTHVDPTLQTIHLNLASKDTSHTP